MAVLNNETGGFLQIQVDHSEIDRLILGTLSTPAQKRIQVRAVNETTAWMRSRLLKELPAATGIPRKALARRIRQGRAKANFNAIITGMVWLGIRPIDAMALKDEGPEGTGYMAGGYFFERGFKANMPRGGTGIFARTGAKRFPVKRQNVRIDSQANEIARRLIRPAQAALMQKMNRLLSFELEQATR